MRRRTTMAALLAAIAALVLAACGGSGPSNGIADKAPGQIVAGATRAIDAVHSVRVTGTVSDKGSSIKLDLQLVNGTGATGSMAENGLSFELISVGGRAYINGSAGFWKQFGGSAAVRLLQGKWLRAPAGRGQFSSFASLTDVHKLLSGILAGHGALTKGPSSTVDGRPVIVLQDKSNPGRPGALDIATTGTPYPIRLIGNAPGGRAQLDFSQFDEPVTITAPAASIDITKLTHAG